MNITVQFQCEMGFYMHVRSGSLIDELEPWRLNATNCIVGALLEDWLEYLLQYNTQSASILIIFLDLTFEQASTIQFWVDTIQKSKLP